MDERIKMLAGELYDANHDKELIRDREIAKDLCYEYNNLKPSNVDARKELLKHL